MKQTHDTYKDTENLDKLINILVMKDKLDEKTRINIYVPKIVVKLLDLLAKEHSRGELVSALILKEAQKQQKLPYGMFSGVEISEKEIDKMKYKLNLKDE